MITSIQEEHYIQSMDEITVAINRTDPRYSEPYLYRGNLYLSRDESDKAIADFTKALEFSYRDPVIYCRRGIAYRKKGDLDRAISDFSLSIGSDPTNAKTYYERGVTYAKQEKFGLAIKDYSQAIHLEPNTHYFYHDRAMAYKELGDNESASIDLTITSELKELMEKELERQRQNLRAIGAL